MLRWLFEKRLGAEVDGRRISVVNHWFKGCALLVDDKEVARNTDKTFLAADVPMIEYDMPIEGGHVTLTVHALAVLFVELDLRVDGIHIAGSDLQDPARQKR